jgi:hypothetical protein
MKNTLIIGSVATYHWFPDFREPDDIDILSKIVITKSKPSDTSNIEVKWFDLCEDIIAQNNDKVFATPDTLLTLKVSHAAWNIHHAKTMSDIAFLQNKGAVLNHELYQKLFKHWETIHGTKDKINLKQDNTEFFTKYVKREFDHDWLHEQVSYPDNPMHKKIRPDISSAFCSKDMWEKLSYEDQLKCAWEEMLVIAIERYKFLEASKKSEMRIALNKAINNLITTMTKGWFNLFLILNNRKIQRRIIIEDLTLLRERISYVYRTKTQSEL